MLAAAAPASFVGDIRFATGKSALAIPFESENDIVYLRVGVNGSPPLTFILDTGASYSILNLPHAKALGLGLQPLGKVEGGSGPEPPDLYLATDSVSIGLPGVVLGSQSVRATLLDQVQGCVDKAADTTKSARRVLDGILGADFFHSLVVEIDYDSRLINLYDPETYRYSGKGKSLPLEVQDYIFVQADVMAPGRRPVKARLFVDTGASLTLSLSRQFAEKHAILPPAKQLTANDNCGIGGVTKAKSWFGSLDGLQIGSFRVSHPETMFYEDPNAQGYDGALGAAAFQHAKVIFDYARHRMVIEQR